MPLRNAEHPRRGLPRAPGGEPWPPHQNASAIEVGPDKASSKPLSHPAQVNSPAVLSAGDENEAHGRTNDFAQIPMRRGLPRIESSRV